MQVNYTEKLKAVIGVYTGAWRIYLLTVVWELKPSEQ